jgi:hypothetical protein
VSDGAWLALAATAALAQCEELVHFSGRPPVAPGDLDYRGSGPLDCCYATRDGWIRLELPGAGSPGSAGSPDGPGGPDGSGGPGGSGRGAEALRRAGVLRGPDPASGGELRARLAAAFAAMTRDEAVRVLTRSGIPAVPVRRLAEVVDDADYVRWETFNRMGREGRPPLLVPGRYAWFSRSRQHRVLQPPGVGEHTAEVLAEVGYSGHRIAELAAGGVVRLGTPMVHRPLPVYR